MSVVINVKGLNEDEDEEDCTTKLCDKCFEFWGHKHPFLVLWIFICCILVISIGISEYAKNK